MSRREPRCTTAQAWAAVFGAVVAAEVRAVAARKGAPDEGEMDGIVEWAGAVADRAVEAVRRGEGR